MGKTSSNEQLKRKKPEKLRVKPAAKSKKSFRIYRLQIGIIHSFLGAGILTKSALILILFQMLRVL